MNNDLGVGVESDSMRINRRPRVSNKHVVNQCRDLYNHPGELIIPTYSDEVRPYDQFVDGNETDAGTH